MAERLLKNITPRKLKGAVKGSEYKREALISYGILLIGYIVLQLGAVTGIIGRNLQGQFVPICVYISLAIALNLVVGLSGELSPRRLSSTTSRLAMARRSTTCSRRSTALSPMA